MPDAVDAPDFLDGRKRAALALLGLHASDRKWLLAQLPSAEREGVAALVGELERMNLPPSAGQIVEAADALNLEPVEPVVESLLDDPRRVLAQAPASLLHQELRDEPDAVIACVCLLDDWPWSAELRGLLGPERAARIAKLPHEIPPPPAAVAQALIAALAAKVKGGHHEAGFAAELRAAGASDAKHAHQGNGRRWSRWFGGLR